MIRHIFLSSSSPVLLFIKLDDKNYEYETQEIKPLINYLANDYCSYRLPFPARV